MYRTGRRQAESGELDQRETWVGLGKRTVEMEPDRQSLACRVKVRNRQHTSRRDGRPQSQNEQDDVVWCQEWDVVECCDCCQLAKRTSDELEQGGCCMQDVSSRRERGSCD